MEFVNKSEVRDVLEQHGYQEVIEGDDRVYLVLPDTNGPVHLHLSSTESETAPREGARVIETRLEDLAGVVEHVIHRLNLSDVILFPVGRWRKVFDAVAFSLAGNESWQEVDASATVELNTRDPLLCGPGDFPLVIDLIRALINDADGPAQGLMLTATAIPVIAEVVPDGAVRLSVGSQALADQILDAVGCEPA